MSATHSRVRKITEDWLNNREKGAKKDDFFLREGNSIYMCRRAYSDPQWVVAIKFPKKNPRTVFINLDIFGTGGQIYTTRAAVMSEIIDDYCKTPGRVAYEFPFSLVRAARFNPYRLEVVDSEIDFCKPGCHRNDLLIAQRRKTNKLLVGLDERRYFGALVSGECENVEQAFEFLKPPEVKEAEKRGITMQRRGEWFFIDRTGQGLEGILAGLWQQEKLYEDSPLKGYELPHEKGKNVHIAHKGGIYQGNIFVTGTIRHHHTRRDFFHGRGTGRHRMIKLEGPWQAVENQNRGNFSSSGFFGGGREGSD